MPIIALTPEPRVIVGAGNWVRELRGSIFDATLNGERTLIHRLPGLTEDSLLLWVHNGAVTAEDLSILALS